MSSVPPCPLAQMISQVARIKQHESTLPRQNPSTEHFGNELDKAFKEGKLYGMVVATEADEAAGLVRNVAFDLKHIDDIGPVVW